MTYTLTLNTMHVVRIQIWVQMLDYVLIFSSLLKCCDSTYKIASTAALKLIMHIHTILKTSQPTAAEHAIFNNPKITYLVQRKQGG